MLGFIRRYQKLFLAVITVAVICSFVFFGTYGAFVSGGSEVADKTVGDAVDGSSISTSRLSAMKRFLGSDRYDGILMEKGELPNFFNDGAIRGDLLESGFAEILFEAYAEEFQEGLAKRLADLKRYRPYRHPFSEKVSVEGIWSKVLPSLKTNLQALRGMETSKEAFSHLVALYLDQGKLSPSIVRQFLAFEEEQAKGKKDPAIAYVDLRINGWGTLSDWFGEEFLSASCQFILNSAIHAKQLGYEMDYETAKGNLLKIGHESLSKQMGGEISKEALENAWRQQLAGLGLDEKTAVKIWQDVLLFRTWLKDVGDQVIIDSLSHEQFQNHLGDALRVVSYEMPAEWQLKNNEDVSRLEVYLEGIGSSKGEFPQEITVKAPELIERKYRVAVGEVTLDEVALRVPVKETWKWESEHLSKIKKTFPELKGTLEEAPSQLRAQIDAFARLQIVLSHPEWIDETFHLVEKEVAFPGSRVFEGVDAELLLPLLDRASEGDSEAIAQLENYTGNQNHFYRIAVLERLGEGRVLSFAEAKQLGVLDKLIDKKLKKLYPQIRLDHADMFRQGEGWKSFEQAKHEVAKLAFPSSVGEGAYERRLLPWIRGIAERMSTGEESAWLDESHPGHLIKRERVVTRDDGVPSSLFELKEGAFSSVAREADGVLRFYQVIGRSEVPREKIAAAVEQTQRLLAREAREVQIKKWVEQIHEQGAIHFERGD